MSRPSDDLRSSLAPVDIDPDEFRRLGAGLVERIAQHLETIRDRPVTNALKPDEAGRVVGSSDGLPAEGTPPAELLNSVADALFENSLFNAHPRFWGYVTSSPTTIGILADFLASAVNPNVGAWKLAPIATEIEDQTVRWVAEFIGYPSTAGGLLVSGGNMANFVGFLAGRRAQAGPDVREKGVGAYPRMLTYCSTETHTWVQKAADLFGHGTDSIGWIPAVPSGEMDVDALSRQVSADKARGEQPCLVVGTAGAVATGVVDPLDEIAAFCCENDLWFHVDGAYGGLAATVPEAPKALASLSLADSVAIDPHKWLYAPLEAGCTLVRDEQSLIDAFSYHPSYYHFKEGRNYFDLGMQNSRGFRALKVWLAFRQVGANAYRKMISDDIRLSRHLFQLLDARPDFEALSNHLSITTFRYVPQGDGWDLDALNQQILSRLETGGEAFVSNAVVDGKFALRACIVNFRTTLDDVEALPDLIVRIAGSPPYPHD